MRPHYLLCNDYGDKNRLIRNKSNKLQIVDNVTILDKVISDENRVRNPFPFWSHVKQTSCWPDTRHIMAARLKKRQSLSVPVRGQLGLRRVHSLSSEPLLGSGAEESQGESGARRSRDLRRSGDLEPGAKRKQKTRTISVPTGLKEILNELSKEVYTQLS